MLTSLALIFLIGSALASLAQLLKLPRIIGLLATGILLGPAYCWICSDPSILSVSSRSAPDGAGHHPAEGRTVRSTSPI